MPIFYILISFKTYITLRICLCMSKSPIGFEVHFQNKLQRARMSESVIRKPSSGQGSYENASFHFRGKRKFHEISFSQIFSFSRKFSRKPQLQIIFLENLCDWSSKGSYRAIFWPYKRFFVVMQKKPSCFLLCKLGSIGIISDFEVLNNLLVFLHLSDHQIAILIVFRSIFKITTYA